jgi:hypothetical protein
MSPAREKQSLGSLFIRVISSFSELELKHRSDYFLGAGVTKASTFDWLLDNSVYLWLKCQSNTVRRRGERVYHFLPTF